MIGTVLLSEDFLDKRCVIVVLFVYKEIVTAHIKFPEKSLRLWKDVIFSLEVNNEGNTLTIFK